MALPTGRWSINANGYTGILLIRGVDGVGNLDAEVTLAGGGPNPVTGFWDDTSKKITFIRVVNRNDPPQNQIYTGFHFTTGSAQSLTRIFRSISGVRRCSPSGALWVVCVVPLHRMTAEESLT
jgi:hypothetical protein